MRNWIENTCRRRCAAQSAIFGGISGLFLVFTLMAFSATSDTLAGPHPMESEDVAALKSKTGLPHDFVSLEVADALDTGVAYVKTRSGKEESRETYWAVPYGEKVLLVKSRSQLGQTVQGTFEKMSADLFSKFAGDDTSALLPVVLEEGDPRIGCWIGDILLAGTAALFGWFFVVSFRRWQNPSSHPAVVRLGNRDEQDAASALLESQLGDPSVVRMGGHDFMRDFLVNQRPHRFDVRRWSDLLWAYQKSTKHSVNFIPTGTTFDAVLCFADGMEVVVQGGRNERVAKGVLAAAQERAPWAVHGFDERTQRAWKKDRAGFCQAVDERRESMRSPRRGG